MRPALTCENIEAIAEQNHQHRPLAEEPAGEQAYPQYVLDIAFMGAVATDFARVELQYFVSSDKGMLHASDAVPLCCTMK